MSLPLALHAQARPGVAVPTTNTEDAFGAALGRHQAELARLIQRLLGWGRDADVDDALQDVLLAAWRHRASFRGDAPLGGWLRRIAVHTVRNHVRRRHRAARLLALVGFAPGREPAASVDLPDRWDPIHAALRQLRHADREVLVRRYLEDLPPAEIAVQLGLRRNAVDARLTRARRRLRQVLPANAGARA